MDRDTQKRLYNLCDPAEPLAPTDPRAIDLDALPGEVRGEPFAEALARRLTLARGPVCELVTAIPGAGLSTEILRVQALLAAPGSPAPLIVAIAAADIVDLSHPIDTPDLLLAILQRAEETVAAAVGEPLPLPLRRLRALFTDSDPALARAWPVEGRFIDNLRTSAVTRGLLRTRVAFELSRFVAEVRDELILLHERARRLGHSGLIVLLDGLERLQGLSFNAGEVLTSAERIFAPDAPARSLPVAIVYTLPPALLTRLDALPRVLPMIALADRYGARNEAGFEAARALLLRRASEAEQDTIFGSERRAERIEQLILASGGSPRVLVRLLQGFIAHPVPTDLAFLRRISAASEVVLRTLPESTHPFLRRLHASKRLAFETLADREAAAQAFAAGAVLPYADEATWFDLHPALEGLAPRAPLPSRAEGTVVA